jgi:carbon storage regulator CsrA
MPARRRPPAGDAGRESIGAENFFSYQQRECSMLVLTRKYQEKIKIGDNITITVLRMKGKTVRLGIEAPESVPVIRGELSFIDSAAEGSNNDAEVEKPAASDRSAKPRARVSSRTSDSDSKWSTSSSPDGKGTPNQEPVPTVGFARVARDQVASVLPKFVSGAAPLRSMMNGR